MKKRKSSITANPGALKDLIGTHKYETRLIGDIERDLMAKHGEPDENRDMTRLHASEMASSEWCPRQSYYRISGTPEDSAGRSFSWVLENVFNEGHDSHHKWQMRVHDLGKLRGVWKCLNCQHRWPATSPEQCPACASTAVEYREVPLVSEDEFIIGHADGDVDEGNADITNDPLIEVKTIGLGTLRYEAPALLHEHTHKVEIKGKAKNMLDYDGVWRDIKRPFPAHLRQGMLYLYLSGRRTMIYIYDCKWNQQVKEFVIRLRPEVVEPLLDTALDVKYHLKVERPIDRPHWAERDCKPCRECPYRKTCWSPVDQEPRPRSDAPDGEGAPVRSRRPVAHRPAPEVRTAGGAAPARRVVRRRDDVAVRRPDPVD